MTHENPPQPFGASIGSGSPSAALDGDGVLWGVPSSYLWIAGLAAPLVIGLIVLLGAQTALITPISGMLLNGMRLIGLTLGLGLGSLMISASSGKLDLFRKAMVVMATAAMATMLFDGLAWRMADWQAFGGSQAEWHRAQYPIEGLSHSSKSNSSSIRIDPYHVGETAKIPITNAEYRQLRGASDGQCVTVMERRNEGGAVEIMVNGAERFGPTGRLEVKPCGETSSASPWAIDRK